MSLRVRRQPICADNRRSGSWVTLLSQLQVISSHHSDICAIGTVHGTASGHCVIAPSRGGKGKGVFSVVSRIAVTSVKSGEPASNLSIVRTQPGTFRCFTAAATSACPWACAAAPP